MAQKKKDRMRVVAHFLPLPLTLAFAWGFGSFLSGAIIENLPQVPYIRDETQNPDTVPLTSPAPWLNTLTIIAIIATSSLIFTLLMRKYKKAFRFLVPILIASAGFSIALFYLDILFIETLYRFAFVKEWMVLWILPPLAGILTLYVILRKHATLLALVVLTAVASGGGASFVTRVPFWTFLVLLPAFSLFDIVMVSAGYLRIWGKTIDKEPSLLHGLIMEYGGKIIGLGDVFFYSALVAFALLRFGVSPALWASGGLAMGYILMMFVVRRGGTWPGLPAPIFLGLGLMFASVLL